MPPIFQAKFVASRFLPTYRPSRSRTSTRRETSSGIFGNSLSPTLPTTSSLQLSSGTVNPATTFLSEEQLVYIRQVELREVRMRLLYPFETSFGVTQDRRIVLVSVSDGDLTGYGEVVAGEGPSYSYETSETAWYVLSEFIIPALIGKEIHGPTE